VVSVVENKKVFSLGANLIMELPTGVGLSKKGVWVLKYSCFGIKRDMPTGGTVTLVPRPVIDPVAEAVAAER
jgi:hypothetical protein